MNRLYKPFFIVYGVAHVLAGLLLFFSPDLFNFILSPTPLDGSAVLICFLSIFAGLALFGIAFVESIPARRRILKLIMVGNVLNAAAHVTNSLRGDAPVFTGPVAAVILALVIILMISMSRSLDAGRGTALHTN